jgi:hypothetical protein
VTPQEVLARAQALGVQVVADSNSLRVRSRGELPEGLRQLLAEHKAGLLAALAAWDQVRADTILAEVLARLDAAAAGRGRTASQLRVLTIYRNLAQRYHRDRDLLLWDMPAVAERLLNEWRR